MNKFGCMLDPRTAFKACLFVQRAFDLTRFKGVTAALYR